MYFASNQSEANRIKTPIVPIGSTTSQWTKTLCIMSVSRHNEQGSLKSFQIVTPFLCNSLPCLWLNLFQLLYEFLLLVSEEWLQLVAIGFHTGAGIASSALQNQYMIRLVIFIFIKPMMTSQKLHSNDLASLEIWVMMFWITDQPAV